MSDAHDKDTREATDALKAIADEVEAEREQGGSTAVPNDDTPEDNAPTREDHEDEPIVDPGVVIHPPRNTPTS
ncbi:hypothetical protein [Demequina globuliformis]|uniref:hypothetical protein n=1 Tax=Demequina globuliformis TaxID=676202 RepID=UPI0007826DD0|nr:hypothetical protein [Demequina globuliformis]